MSQKYKYDASSFETFYQHAIGSTFESVQHHLHKRKEAKTEQK